MLPVERPLNCKPGGYSLLWLDASLMPSAKESFACLSKTNRTIWGIAFSSLKKRGNSMANHSVLKGNSQPSNLLWVFQPSLEPWEFFLPSATAETSNIADSTQRYWSIPIMGVEPPLWDCQPKTLPKTPNYTCMVLGCSFPSTGLPSPSTGGAGIGLLNPSGEKEFCRTLL